MIKGEWNPDFFSVIVLIKSQTMIILVQKSCLHNDCKRNQSRTKIPYTICGRLLQQEAAIFSLSPSTPPRRVAT